MNTAHYDRVGDEELKLVEGEDDHEGGVVVIDEVEQMLNDMMESVAEDS